jgi:hypothetical protein
MKSHVRDELKLKNRNSRALCKEDWQQRSDFASSYELTSLGDCGILFFAFRLSIIFL